MVALSGYYIATILQLFASQKSHQERQNVNVVVINHIHSLIQSYRVKQPHSIRSKYDIQSPASCMYTALSSVPNDPCPNMCHKWSPSIPSDNQTRSDSIVQSKCEVRRNKAMLMSEVFISMQLVSKDRIAYYHAGTTHAASAASSSAAARRASASRVSATASHCDSIDFGEKICDEVVRVCCSLRNDDFVSVIEEGQQQRGAI